MFYLKFYTSDAARKSALLNGQLIGNPHTLKVNENELTPQQRETLAKVCSPTEGATIGIWSGSMNITADGWQIQDVCDAIEAALAAQQRKEAESREYNTRIANEYLAGGNTLPGSTGDDELDGAVKAESARREQERKTKEAEEAGKRKAEHEAKVEQMRLWALQNGSDHLKDLLTMGFNWQEIARSEYIAANTPEGFADIQDLEGYDKSYPIKKPSPICIATLKRALKDMPEANPMLLRGVFQKEEAAYVANYLSIEIAPPVGEAVRVEKWIEDATRPGTRKKMFVKFG